MQIITGTARGRRLQTPEGLGTRPTPARVKEALFSAIQFDIEGRRVLDLFAGSGQLGLEALSRGAAHATFVDNNAAAVAAIRANLTHTKLAATAVVLQQDALTALALRGDASPGDAYDLAFLDPPYTAGLLTQCLTALAPRMHPGGIVICESDTAAPPPPESVGCLHLQKTYCYGHTVLYKYHAHAAENLT